MDKLIAKQTEIKIGDISLKGYKLSNNSWCLSIRGLAAILNKDDKGVRNFIDSTLPKTSPDIDLKVRKVEIENGSLLRMVTIEVAGEYLTHWAFKGDKKAQELVRAFTKQSLELRLEASLPEDKSLKEQVHKVTNKYLDVQSERERQKQNQIQNYFQMWCEAKGMNPAYVHDYITSSVIGRKAKDSRELPLYSGMNFFVGLDHYQENENEEMNLISQIKDKLPKKFPRKKKDYNYKNYVDEVIQEITV